MKRSIKHLLTVIVILLSILGSGIGATPGSALGAMGSVSLPMPDLPPGQFWNTSSVSGIWGTDPENAYIVGVGTPGAGMAPEPLVFDLDPVPGGGTQWSSYRPGIAAGCTTGTLEAVWSSGTGNIHAVGSGSCNGTTLPVFYRSVDDGANWSKQSFTPPDTIASDSEGVWGFSTGVVYAVGSGFVGGFERPIVYDFNGASWNSMRPTLSWTRGHLSDVWGSYNAGTNSYTLFAVGYGSPGGANRPLIFRYTTATGWQHMVVGLPGGWTQGELTGVWGSSEGDVYAVGWGALPGVDAAPLAYHYSAGAWTRFSPALPSGWGFGRLESVWGFDANNVFFAGYGDDASDKQNALFYRRTSSGGWAASSYVTGWGYLRFFDVWGSGPDDVYAAGLGNNGGDLGVLFHGVIDAMPPGNVSSLNSGPGLCNGSILLTWTDPADDGTDATTGPVESYAVKMKVNAPFGSWDDTVGVTEITTGLPVPARPLASQSMTVSGLNPANTYYFAVKARDDDGLMSTGYATDSTPGLVQTNERSATWFIPGTSAAFGTACDIPVHADYTGDGRTDIAVFRPLNGTWYINGLGTSYIWGAPGDIPVPYDYDGDGGPDIAVFRPSNSTWYINGRGAAFLWGTVGDIPVVADYDGNGMDDVAVFRPSNSTWYIAGLPYNFVWGTVGDIPVVADYDGNGTDDVAVFRPSNSTWYIVGRGAAFVWGTVGDIPVPADYNGDGMDEVAVFRPSNSTWYIAGYSVSFVFGTTGDVPVVGDYTGDGVADVAIFRP